MDNFSDNLVSLQWWLGVVVVGVLLNLVSAYLKPKLDQVLGRVSDRWRNRSETKRQKRKRLVEFLRDNPSEHIYWIADEMRARFRVMLYMVMSVAVLILALYAKTKGELPELTVYGIHGFAVLLIFMAMVEFADAIDSKRLIAESRSRDGL